MVSEVKIEHFEQGDLIFKEGDPGFHFYIIQSGSIEIFRTNAQGKKIVISTLSEGDAFGEFALIDQAPRSASARALKDSSVAVISENDYKDLLQQLPEWAKTIMEAMVSRLKFMNDKLTDKEQFLNK